MGPRVGDAVPRGVLAALLAAAGCASPSLAPDPQRPLVIAGRVTDVMDDAPPPGRLGSGKRRSAGGAPGCGASSSVRSQPARPGVGLFGFVNTEDHCWANAALIAVAVVDVTLRGALAAVAPAWLRPALLHAGDVVRGRADGPSSAAQVARELRRHMPVMRTDDGACGNDAAAAFARLLATCGPEGDVTSDAPRPGQRGDVGVALNAGIRCVNCAFTRRAPAPSEFALWVAPPDTALQRRRDSVHMVLARALEEGQVQEHDRPCPWCACGCEHVTTVTAVSAVLPILLGDGAQRWHVAASLLPPTLRCRRRTLSLQAVVTHARGHFVTGLLLPTGWLVVDDEDVRAGLPQGEAYLAVYGPQPLVDMRAPSPAPVGATAFESPAELAAALAAIDQCALFVESVRREHEVAALAGAGPARLAYAELLMQALERIDAVDTRGVAVVLLRRKTLVDAVQERLAAAARAASADSAAVPPPALAAVVAALAAHGAHAAQQPLPESQAAPPGSAAAAATDGAVAAPLAGVAPAPALAVPVPIVACEAPPGSPPAAANGLERFAGGDGGAALTPHATTPPAAEGSAARVPAGAAVSASGVGDGGACAGSHGDVAHDAPPRAELTFREALHRQAARLVASRFANGVACLACRGPGARAGVAGSAVAFLYRHLRSCAAAGTHVVVECSHNPSSGKVLHRCTAKQRPTLDLSATRCGHCGLTAADVAAAAPADPAAARAAVDAAVRAAPAGGVAALRAAAALMAGGTGGDAADHSGALQWLLLPTSSVMRAGDLIAGIFVGEVADKAFLERARRVDAVRVLAVLRAPSSAAVAGAWCAVVLSAEGGQWAGPLRAAPFVMALHSSLCAIGVWPAPTSTVTLVATEWGDGPLAAAAALRALCLGEQLPHPEPSVLMLAAAFLAGDVQLAVGDARAEPLASFLLAAGAAYAPPLPAARGPARVASDPPPPRGAQRFAAIEFARTTLVGIDVDVTTEQLDVLLASPPPAAGWSMFRGRGGAAAAEIFARALRLAAPTGVEADAEALLRAARLLMALPRLVWCVPMPPERAVDALLGPTATEFVAAAVEHAAVRAAAPRRPRSAASLARGMLARNRVMTAITVMSKAPLSGPGWATEQADDVAFDDDLGVPAAAPDTTPLSDADKARLAERLLPQHGTTSPEDLAAIAAAVPHVHVSPRDLRRTNWRRLVRDALPYVAPGPDGLRNEHVSAMLFSPGGGTLRTALATFVAALLQHGFEAAPVAGGLLAAVRLTYIPKTDGEWRPLGVISTLRRLITRALVRVAVHGMAPWLLARGQLGVRVAAGCEVLARRVQAAHDRGVAFALIDRRNAYGSARPDAVRAAAVAAMPAVAMLLLWILGVTRVFGGGTVTHWQGLFQGCPLSALLFALVLEAAIDAILLADFDGCSARVALRRLGVDCAGFLDDGVLDAHGAAADRCPSAVLSAADAATDCGLPAVLRAVTAVSQSGAAVGVCLNPLKSRIVTPFPSAAAAATAAAVGVRLSVLSDMDASQRSWLVVGVPVGGAAARRAHAARLVRRLLVATERLLARASVVDGLHLLRVSRGYPSLVHLQRSLPPDVAAPLCAPVDVLRDVYLARVLFLPCDELRALPLYAAVGLPQRCGGRGLRGAAACCADSSIGGALLAGRVERVIYDEAASQQLLRRRYVHAGRPVRGALGPLTSGCRSEARCGMPVADGCAHAACCTCCVARDGVGCPSCASLAARELAAADAADFDCNGRLPAPGSQAEAALLLPTATIASWADAAGLPFAAAGLVLRLAARYQRPQRAVTCARFVRDMRALVSRLGERSREVAVLRSAAGVIGRATWCTTPLATDVRLPDGPARVALCAMLDVPLLLGGDPVPLVCAPSRAGALSCRVADALGGPGAMCGPRDIQRHWFACPHGGGVSARHRGIAHVNRDFQVEWGNVVQLESQLGFVAPEDHQRRLDVVVVGAADAQRHAAFDVTVTSAPPCAGVPVAEQRARGKMAKYAPLLDDTVRFTAMSFDTVGAVNHSAVVLLAFLAARAAETIGCNPVDLQQAAWVRIAVELWSHLAAQAAVGLARVVRTHPAVAAQGLRVPSPEALLRARKDGDPYLPLHVRVDGPSLLGEMMAAFRAAAFAQASGGGAPAPSAAWLARPAERALAAATWRTLPAETRAAFSTIAGVDVAAALDRAGVVVPAASSVLPSPPAPAAAVGCAGSAAAAAPSVSRSSSAPDPRPVRARRAVRLVSSAAPGDGVVPSPPRADSLPLALSSRPPGPGRVGRGRLPGWAGLVALWSARPAALAPGASGRTSLSGSTGRADVLLVKRVHAAAVAPARGSAHAAGFDLGSVAALVIGPGRRAVVHTGIAMALPPGTYGRVAPRSGLAVSHGIDVGAGVVDCDYRGEVCVVLFNHGDAPFAIVPGDRVAQLIVTPFVSPAVVVVADGIDLGDTVRGDAGFGSSGVGSLPVPVPVASLPPLNVAPPGASVRLSPRALRRPSPGESSVPVAVGRVGAGVAVRGVARFVTSAPLWWLCGLLLVLTTLVGSGWCAAALSGGACQASRANSSSHCGLLRGLSGGWVNPLRGVEGEEGVRARIDDMKVLSGRAARRVRDELSPAPRICSRSLARSCGVRGSSAPSAPALPAGTLPWRRQPLTAPMLCARRAHVPPCPPRAYCARGPPWLSVAVRGVLASSAPARQAGALPRRCLPFAAPVLCARRAHVPPCPSRAHCARGPPLWSVAERCVFAGVVYSFFSCRVCVPSAAIAPPSPWCVAGGRACQLCYCVLRSRCAAHLLAFSCFSSVGGSTSPQSLGCAAASAGVRRWCACPRSRCATVAWWLCARPAHAPPRRARLATASLPASCCARVSPLAAAVARIRVSCYAPRLAFPVSYYVGGFGPSSSLGWVVGSSGVRCRCACPCSLRAAVALVLRVRHARTPPRRLCARCLVGPLVPPALARCVIVVNNSCGCRRAQPTPVVGVPPAV